MSKRIFLSPPHMGGNELKYIQEAFDENYIAPLGKNVNLFEKAICDFTGATDCVALSSGTAAIHLALIILGIGRGDEVLCSSFSFCASVNPVVYQGATPVLIDSEATTWNMSPELLEKAIKDRIEKTGKAPKALILVHLYGMPVQMNEIFAITKKYNIPVIEDAAEALGSKYDGECLGTKGMFGVFSFNGNKIITTSGGGALVGNKELIDKARFLSAQALDDAPYYQHSSIGYNYRMSNILAGIGRGQMEVLAERIEQCRKNYSLYKDVFIKMEGITFLDEPDERYYSNYWLTTILIDPKQAGFSAYDMLKVFKEENIEARYLWKPMHLQPIFSEAASYIDGTSEKLFKSGVCLPSGTSLSAADQERIISVIKKHFT